MLATFLSAKDQEHFRSPQGWDFTIYGLKPKEFWFSKVELPIADGCEIVRWDFRGPIRFRAVMQEPKLQVNFIDSYSTVGSRLQGRGKIDSVVMITSKNHAWDGLTDVGAVGIEINFDEVAAASVLTPDLKRLLTGGLSRERSIIAPVTSAGQRLKSLAMRYLSLVDRNPELSDASLMETALQPTHINLQAYMSDSADLRGSTLIEMARNVIDEAAGADFSAPEVSSQKRREIALKIEHLLWHPPFLLDDDFGATLEEFAALFRVKSRTIQIAIQEQFGMGFVALRRLVRLTQLRRAILSSKGRSNLSMLAADHRLHFGRLSKEYREMFGLRPSHEMSAVRKSIRSR